MQKERRRTKRFQLDSPCRFRIYTPSRPETISPYLTAQIHDLSENGMRFHTDSVQSEGLHIFHPNAVVSEQCLLEIEIPGKEGPFTIHGKVIWYDRNPDEHPYAFQAGIEFVNLDREMKKKMQQTLREFLAPS